MSLFVNDTLLVAKPVPMIDREGRNVVVVIAKATYAISPEGELLPADEPEPIHFADQMLGDDPATALLRIPSDLVDSKPAVDLLLIAPGQPVGDSPLYGRRVGVEVGGVNVGGSVGSTWAFGAVRRDAAPRKNYGGTYDSNWASDRMPLLPKDFDSRYHQAAPPSQVIPKLEGDEPFRVSGLYDGNQTISGKLPGRAVVVAACAAGRYFTEFARLDTVCVFSEKPIVALTWRLAIPTKRAPSEVTLVFVYYPRLDAARELYFGES